MDLKDKVIVITGAAGALGGSVTARLAGAGARLALVDRAEDRLAGQFGHMPDALLIGGVNLTEEASVAAMAARASDHFGRIDGLINVAGGYRANARIHETPLADWEFLLDLNAKSVFLACRAVLPAMMAAGGGKIASIAAKPALEAGVKGGPYGVSKAAVIRLTEAIAKEYAAERIWANCVIPGTIDTPANRESMPGADFSRWVSAEQIAAVLHFLMSPESDAISGAAIPVYGRAG